MIPSPQLGEHTEAYVTDPEEQIHLTLALKQPRLHPMSSFDPSSHNSPGTTFPSPHIGTHFVGTEESHSNPDKGPVQVWLHPTFGYRSASSHVSESVITPSPQLLRHMVG